MSVPLSLAGYWWEHSTVGHPLRSQQIRRKTLLSFLLPHLLFFFQSHHDSVCPHMIRRLFFSKFMVFLVPAPTGGHRGQKSMVVVSMGSANDVDSFVSSTALLLRRQEMELALSHEIRLQSSISSPAHIAPDKNSDTSSAKSELFRVFL